MNVKVTYSRSLIGPCMSVGVYVYSDEQRLPYITVLYLAIQLVITKICYG